MKSKAARKRQRTNRRSRKKAIQENRVENKSDVATVPKVKESTAVPNTNTNPASNASALWRGIYESLVFRQCDVQIEYWKERARQLEKENEELRWRLRAIDIPPYETSSEDEDDEQQRYLDEGEEYDEKDISPEYFEFRSVTLKHREELRKQREKESIENSNSKSIAK